MADVVHHLVPIVVGEGGEIMARNLDTGDYISLEHLEIENQFQAVDPCCLSNTPCTPGSPNSHVDHNFSRQNSAKSDNSGKSDNSAAGGAPHLPSTPSRLQRAASASKKTLTNALKGRPFKLSESQSDSSCRRQAAPRDGSATDRSSWDGPVEECEDGSARRKGDNSQRRKQAEDGVHHLRANSAWLKCAFTVVSGPTPWDPTDSSTKPPRRPAAQHDATQHNDLLRRELMMC